MAMLAESKKKQKWSLNPRGSAWVNDSSKFGEKLLRKMGWSDGEGLGANSQGIKEHIKVKVKHDSKGFGFKDKDNIWVEVENDFSKLLAKLSSNSIEKEPDTSDSNTCVNNSLEEKSKKSKARVHYQKFTRGKDISRYSSKDLECIFGVTKKSNQSDLEENKNFVSSGNMNEYFHSKTKKTGSDSVSLNEKSENRKRKCSEDIDGNMMKIEKKKQKRKDKIGAIDNFEQDDIIDNYCTLEDRNEDIVEQNVESIDIKVKKKKSKKKNKIENNSPETEELDHSNKDIVMKKSKKKKKNKEEKTFNGLLMVNQVDGSCDLSEMEEIASVDFSLESKIDQVNEHDKSANEKKCKNTIDTIECLSKDKCIDQLENYETKPEINVKKKKLRTKNSDIVLNIIKQDSDIKIELNERKIKTNCKQVKHIHENKSKVITDSINQNDKKEDILKQNTNVIKDLKSKILEIQNLNHKLYLSSNEGKERSKEELLENLNEKNEHVSKRVEDIVQTKISNYLCQVFNRKDKIVNPKRELKEKRKEMILNDGACIEFKQSNLSTIAGYSNY